MIRPLYALPAILCLTAVVVTAQAPAGNKPADNPQAAEQPTAQQPTAQQPTTPRPTTPPYSAQEPARPADASAMTANKVTYTGCIKPGTTAGAWILENAEVAHKAGASAPGAVGTAVGTSGTAKVALSLEPAATVNLTPHANHKVELVGTMSAAKGTAASPSSATAGAQAHRQHFSVESLKMVSATCP